METNGPVLTAVFYGWFGRLKDIGCTAADGFEAAGRPEPAGRMIGRF